MEDVRGRAPAVSTPRKPAGRSMRTAPLHTFSRQLRPCSPPPPSARLGSCSRTSACAGPGGAARVRAWPFGRCEQPRKGAAAWPHWCRCKADTGDMGASKRQGAGGACRPGSSASSMYGGLLSTPHSCPSQACSGAYHSPATTCRPGRQPDTRDRARMPASPELQAWAARRTSTAACRPNRRTFSSAQARARALHSTASTRAPGGSSRASPTASAPLPVPRSAHAPPRSSGRAASACAGAAGLLPERAGRARRAHALPAAPGCLRVGF